MSAFAPWFIVGSAGVILALGLMHLLYTFCGTKLLPRDPDLHLHMQQVSPNITRGTTMWKAWVGFNASHSFGAILFGAAYGYLSLVHAAFLFQSIFLLTLGLLLLGGYAILGKRYWFSVPFRSVLAATALYVTALIINWG